MKLSAGRPAAVRAAPSPFGRFGSAHYPQGRVRCLVGQPDGLFGDQRGQAAFGQFGQEAVDHGLDQGVQGLQNGLPCLAV